MAHRVANRRSGAIFNDRVTFSIILLYIARLVKWRAAGNRISTDTQLGGCQLGHTNTQVLFKNRSAEVGANMQMNTFKYY